MARGPMFCLSWLLGFGHKTQLCSVYIYIYTYIYIYIHTYIHIYIYINIFIYNTHIIYVIHNATARQQGEKLFQFHPIRLGPSILATHWIFMRQVWHAQICEAAPPEFRSSRFRLRAMGSRDAAGAKASNRVRDPKEHREVCVAHLVLLLNQVQLHLQLVTAKGPSLSVPYLASPATATRQWTDLGAPEESSSRYSVNKV